MEVPALPGLWTLDESQAAAQRACAGDMSKGQQWGGFDLMDKLEEVTHCGMYCSLCAGRRRIPEQAYQLRETLRQEGYDRGYYDIPGLETVFNAFGEGLNLLANQPCPGCCAGGGNPGFAIRACALERRVYACPLCAEYPCARLAILKNYPLRAADGQRIHVIGINQWADEQEERAKCGFTYADIRWPE